MCVQSGSTASLGPRPPSGTKTPATKGEGCENLEPSAIEALIPRYPLPIAKSDSISRSRAGFTPSSTNSHAGSAAGESKKSLVSARQLDPGICSVQQGHSSRLSQHRNIDSNQHP